MGPGKAGDTMTTLFLRGDARAIPLADTSVHCVVTSPPYWNLRDYQTGKWEGGAGDCDHKPSTTPGQRGVASSTLCGGQRNNCHRQEGYRGSCPRCGAIRIDRQIGLEATVQQYLDELRTVFAEIWRILRDDGTLWLNLGDCYTDSSMTGGNNGLKPKDLVGVPWRIAFMLQAGGWWLRAEVTWCKKAPMPESITDRPTNATEKVFLLAKATHYFYDAAAVKEPSVSNGPSGNGYKRAARLSYRDDTGAKGSAHRWQRQTTRNMRNYLVLAPEPYSGAHFAVMPTALVEICIKAGCPIGGIVFDPFSGSGTVPMTADRLGRHGIGLDLSDDYSTMARTRVYDDAPLLSMLNGADPNEQLDLFREIAGVEVV